MTNKRFLIASGGTGGHFYPGFALGKLLNKRECSVLFVVRKDDPAIHILQDNGLKYREIDFMGMPRTLNPLKYLKFIWKLNKSLRETQCIIKEFKPDIAVGTGGYISFPLIFSAYFKGVKTAVHDSNTKIGLANRVCSHFTKLFMLGLPTNEKIKNAVLTGTPIRKEFADPINRKQLFKELDLDPALKTVLIFGGSQGAKGLNQVIINTVKELVSQNDNVQFVHISGERWYGVVHSRYGRTLRVRVLPYSNEMYELMQLADAVVCRAGASTIAELIYCQKPVLFVPFPQAAANHQLYNAKLLQSVGCAMVVEEGPRLENELLSALLRMLNSHNDNTLKTMQENYSKLDIPNPLHSAELIADTLQKL